MKWALGLLLVAACTDSSELAGTYMSRSCSFPITIDGHRVED